MLACLASLLLQPATAQQRVDLSINEARNLATQALFAGDTALALTVADAILQGVPDDRAALLVIAAGAPRVGDPARGQAAGARAYRLSQTPEERYEAARLTALAASIGERFTTATFWLRLALISAPNEAERARTITDARTVTARNPLQLQVFASLAPSSNVNGGAESAISSAPGNPDGLLSEDAVALEGWRASLGLGASYRLQESRESRTTVSLSMRASRVRITEETTVPDEAFASGSVEASLRHERVLGEGLLGLTFGLGQFDYRDLGGDFTTTEYETYSVARLQADYRMALSPEMTLSLTAGHESLSYEAAGIGEVDRNRLGATLDYRLASGDRLSLSADLAKSSADSPNYVSQEGGLRLGYSLAEPVGPVTLSAFAGYRWADYPEYRLLNAVTGGRQDETAFASISLGFPQVEFAGFVPGLQIDASKTQSNVSRFDRTSLGASLTIQSSF